jgi:spermidine synthase
MLARKSFWSIERTLREAGSYTMPYHAHVPSFGEWGYVLASKRPVTVPDSIRAGTSGLRYLSDALLPSLFVFPKDMEQIADVPVQRLNDQALIRLYDDELGVFD